VARLFSFARVNFSLGRIFGKLESDLLAHLVHDAHVGQREVKRAQRTLGAAALDAVDNVLRFVCQTLRVRIVELLLLALCARQLVLEDLIGETDDGQGELRRAAEQPMQANAALCSHDDRLRRQCRYDAAR
jgi:hypothetical protein